MTELNDIQLYQRVLQKDKVAFEKLYDRYERLIYSFVFKMTSDPQISEDIIQEVFLKLWRKHAAYTEEKGRFSSWLLTLTRNTVLDSLRRHKGEASYEMIEKDSIQTDHYESVEDLVEWKEKGTLIRGAVSSLKEEQQKMINLFYFKGHTQKKISEMTDLPLGTVKGRIRLALRHLKSYLDKEGGKTNG